LIVFALVGGAAVTIFFAAFELCYRHGCGRLMPNKAPEPERICPPDLNFLCYGKDKWFFFWAVCTAVYPAAILCVIGGGMLYAVFYLVPDVKSVISVDAQLVFYGVAIGTTFVGRIFLYNFGNYLYHCLCGCTKRRREGQETERLVVVELGK